MTNYGKFLILLMWTYYLGTPYIGSEEKYYSRFQLPPLDLELLNKRLENEPVAEPTAKEVAAYHFLKHALGK